MARAESNPASGRIRSVPLKHRVDVLSADEVRKVHEGALAVLERVGVGFTSERFLKSLAEAGARVDFDAKRVWFPPELVEEKRKLAPESFLLAGRDPGCDLPLEGRRGYLSTDGCPAEIVDLDSGERRYSTKDDLAQVTRIADALPEIAFHWQPVSANDTPTLVRPIHETQVQLANTDKHIQQMTAIDAFNARGIVEMARVIAGGENELRARPVISNFQCSLSPLAWDEGPLEAMEIFAEAGVPVGICSMPIACATGPATAAGILTMATAEILSGVVALETINPGAATFFISFATTMDLNSGAMNLGWGADDLFIEMASVQVARHLGLPSQGGTFATGAKRPDWQAGVQNALSCITSVLSPSDMLAGAGSVYDASVYSLENLLLDAEIFDLLCRWVEGASFDDEHLGIEAIEAVGPGGHFLASRHTLDYMREFWIPKYFNRDSWEDWVAAGKPDPIERARAEVRRILAEHEPAPLADDVRGELDRIVLAYEREATEG